MKIILQRVKNASVTVDSAVIGRIEHGLLIFLGVSQLDTKDNADALIAKIIQLRIFNDDNGKMNLSALDVNAQFLVVSQFTLYGNCQKGRRPSFDKAAEPKIANELYEYFVTELKKNSRSVQTGKFGADMDVALVNDGPVTFILESDN